jgi:hypothetical protein
MHRRVDEEEIQRLAEQLIDGFPLRLLQPERREIVSAFWV